MTLFGPRLFRALLGVVVVAASVGSQPMAAAASSSSGTTFKVSSSGTASFAAGTPALSGADFTDLRGTAGTEAHVVNRTGSSGGSGPVGAVAQPKTVTLTTPGLATSFDGLNHFQQRKGSGDGQFSLEPPDQGLCVGSDGTNLRVLEVTNDVMRVYDTSGSPVTAPMALNAFFGYAEAINRGTGTFGPFVTDPSCLFDAASGHWFLDVLTLETVASGQFAGQFTGVNHLDLAVSMTSDPTAGWKVYSFDIQDDGTNGINNINHGCTDPAPPPGVTNPFACLGDYPHMGSDANGLYLTTNEYSLFGPEFHGAQVYAFSKSQLASLAPSVSATQFDTHGLNPTPFALNGFTLWPSTTPGGGGESGAGGTEFFLSTNAAGEAHDTGNGVEVFQPSTQLLVWALSNTSSLSGTPALNLTVTKVDVGLYTLPPHATQKAGNQPLRNCLNSNPCVLAIFGLKDPFAEKSADLDSNDTRMQQTTWVNGHLWGAMDTGLSISSKKQAGIEWFDVMPTVDSSGNVSAVVSNQGYLGLGNDNLTYPAIGITSSGSGVMAFTVVGADFYPSAGYAMIGPGGVSDVHIAAMGMGPADGFTDYKLFGVVPGTTRPRWGDYGAAVPLGNSVWIASEYIGQSCDFSTYLRTAFLCGNTRTFFANWGTRISLVNVS